MINNDTKSKWLILSEGFDIHYIGELMTWKEALLNHIEWCYSSVKIKLYTKSFDGFTDFSEAIALYNEIFKDDEIGGLIPVTDDCYLDIEHLY